MSDFAEIPMFNLFSVLAEYERDLICERTLAGLKAARVKGRCGGRPQKMTKPILKVIASEMKDRKPRVLPVVFYWNFHKVFTKKRMRKTYLC